MEFYTGRSAPPMVSLTNPLENAWLSLAFFWCWGHAGGTWSLQKWSRRKQKKPRDGRYREGIWRSRIASKAEYSVHSTLSSTILSSSQKCSRLSTVDARLQWYWSEPWAYYLSPKLSVLQSHLCGAHNDMSDDKSPIEHLMYQLAGTEMADSSDSHEAQQHSGVNPIGAQLTWFFSISCL